MSSSNTPLQSYRTRRSINSLSSKDSYRLLLQQTDESFFSKLNDIVPSMSCATAEQGCLPKLECVMGRCSSCPTIPIPSFEISDANSLDHISYGMYMYHTKCKKHGILKDKATSCPECSKEIEQCMISNAEKIIGGKKSL